DAHRKLVAKVSRGRIAHPRDSKVFAKKRGGLLIVFVERDDTVNALRTRDITDAFDYVVSRIAVGHVENFVDRFARPGFVTELFNRQEQDAAPVTAALAKKRLTFEVAGQAQHRELIRHITSNQDREII